MKKKKRLLRSSLSFMLGLLALAIAAALFVFLLPLIVVIVLGVFVLAIVFFVIWGVIFLAMLAVAAMFYLFNPAKVEKVKMKKVGRRSKR